MREIAKSALSFSWAMPLFAVKQMMNVLANPGNPTEKATHAFDATTLAAGSQMGDMTQSLFLVSDDLQREMVDMMFDMLSPQALDPGGETTSRFTKMYTETIRSLTPGLDGGLTWQELSNKMEVFQLVLRVASLLNLPSEPPYPMLEELAARAYGLEQYPALWAVEGLGHYYGDTFWKRKEVPQGIMREKHTGDLPEGSLLMLHAGVGMSIAQHVMKTINHLSPPTDIRRALERIISLCRENSRPGYEGATLESLGLITRSGQFYGETCPEEMARIVGRELEQIDPEVHGYFWHGAGRATYFLPIHFIPGYGAMWHVVDAIRRVAPDETARRNAMSGLAWGVTMVNVRHPKVLANLLKHIGDHEDDLDACSNGVISGMMMRCDTTPGAPFIPPLYQTQPDAADGRLVQMWEQWVQTPCEETFQEIYPALKKQQHLGDIFRYHAFQDLMDRSESDR